jgi:ribosomal protein S18 acetylase RimI-like enzyme
VPEIRRIRIPEAAAVAALWDRMCRETPDGAPLTGPGRRSIQRMLEISSWHHRTFCLVAVERDQVAGFVVGRVDPADGLLPSLVGEIHETYVPAESGGAGLARQLVEAAVATLRDRGARATIRHLTAADDLADQELFAGLGFEADMVCLSLYREDSDEC